MNHAMDGMGWYAGGVWILVVLFLILGIAAFVKYLMSKGK